MTNTNTPAATVAALMAPMASLYRRGTVKPGAVAVTPAQFDALCDMAAAAPELLAALAAMVAAHTKPSSIIQAQKANAAALAALAKAGAA